MHPRNVLHATVLGLALVATPSWAESPPVAQAQLTQFQIQLVDLDTADAVVPSLSLSDGYLRTANDRLFPVTVVSPLQGGSQSGSAGAYTVVAAVAAGNPSTPGQGPGASAALYGLGQGDTQVEAAVTYGSFTLSARTSVTFSAIARAQLLAPLPGRVHFAGANMSVWDTVPGLSVGSMPFIDAMIGGTGFGTPDKPDTGDVTLSLTITNNTDGTLGGNLYAGAYVVNFAGPTPPVPEPGAWALFAAGLALLAPWARRRGGLGRA